MTSTSPPGKLFTDAQRAHLVLRLTLGLNILAHGIVRVGHPVAFADALVHQLEKTLLPAWTIRPFALVLRTALTAGGLLIAALTVGVCLNQDWEVAGLQLLYALAYFTLSSRVAEARCTVDELWFREPRLARAR
ncbi:MAG: hypothetical protein K0S65_5381 [Labilithrix sp.]|nr:hypothetical protein [Labilithrix sp.]